MEDAVDSKSTERVHSSLYRVSSNLTYPTICPRSVMDNTNRYGRFIASSNLAEGTFKDKL